MRIELHPQQSKAFRSQATEILFGGAAGGGKSHLKRAVGIAMCVAVPGLRVGLIRREYPDLKANHFEGRTSIPMMLAPLIVAGQVKYNVTDLSLTFANGSRLIGKHCQRESDLMGFQGDEFDVLLLDELTHFTATMYRFLRSRCRSAGLTVPAGLPWTFPRILASSNPGGPGHTWVKEAWIDAAAPGAIWRASDDEGGMLRQFIPAKLEDNPSLNAADYLGKLQGLGNPALVKAMRDGDWNIVAGGMFDDVFDPVAHVVEPFHVPPGWRVDRSFDWGSSKPFSVGWWAESDGNAVVLPGRTLHYPKGTLVRVAEWYGWNGKANEGCRMLATEIGRGVVEREREMQKPGGILHGRAVNPGPADSAIYATENGVCIADDMARVGCGWTEAQKGPGSRINGWERMRRLLKDAKPRPMESPGLLVFSTCRQFLRTVPVLGRDKTKTDDVDTNAEDHVADEVRYRCQLVKREGGAVALP